MISTKVATTIGKGIVDASNVTQTVVLAGVIGAITWNLITWYYGLPSSSSHAIIGGIAGSVFAHAGLDALDGRIDSAEQLRLYRFVRDLLRRQSGFFLRQHRFRDGLEQGIAPYAQGIAALSAAMATLLPEKAVARLGEAEERLRETGLSPDFARRVAALEPLAQALDIVRVAGDMETPVEDAARVVFAIRDAFHLDDIAAASEALAGGDHFNRLAVDASLAGIASAQRRLARSILAQSTRRPDFATWRARNEAAVSRVAEGLAEVLSGRGLTLAKLTVAVAQFRDLSAP
jgi:NAD-specific glutamate dehydrogenase